MLTVLKAALGAILGAVVEAWNSWRRDRALKKLGELEAKEGTHEESAEARAKLREIRHRIANDAEFRRRVRDKFRSTKS